MKHSCLWAAGVLDFLNELQYVVAAGRRTHSLTIFLRRGADAHTRTSTVFAALRIYALCARKIWIALAVFLLSMVTFGVNLVSTTRR